MTPPPHSPRPSISALLFPPSPLCFHALIYSIFPALRSPPTSFFLSAFFHVEEKRKEEGEDPFSNKPPLL